MSPKDKVSKMKLISKMSLIHERILEKLFVASSDSESEEDDTSGTYLIDSDEEYEPEDHSLEMNYSYGLAAHIS